jgi:hypothetical protein
LGCHFDEFLSLFAQRNNAQNKKTVGDVFIVGQTTSTSAQPSERDRIQFQMGAMRKSGPDLLKTGNGEVPGNLSQPHGGRRKHSIDDVLSSIYVSGFDRTFEFVERLPPHISHRKREHRLYEESVLATELSRADDTMTDDDMIKN